MAVQIPYNKRYKRSQNNYLLTNEHHGVYPGWSNGGGLWNFDADSTNNTVMDPGPEGLDTTDQLQDLGTDNELFTD